MAAIVKSKSSAFSSSTEVKPLSVLQTIIAGGGARSIAQAITYPMDALRTLAQTRKGAAKLKDLGPGVLVSGCLSTSMFAFPTGAIQFTVFGKVKKALTKIVGSEGATGTAVALVSSACASLTSCAVGVPQEVLKQRLVTNIYPNFRTAVKTIFEKEGLMGFYTGWAPTVARNLPYVCITFTTFNHWKTQELKRLQEAGSQDKSLETKTSLKFGVGAALIGTLFTQPIDVVKTRMMTQAASNLVPYSNAIACFKDIVATEGVTAFFAGLPPRALYIGPLWAAQFMLNEKLTRYFGQKNAAAAMAAQQEKKK